MGVLLFVTGLKTVAHSLKTRHLQTQLQLKKFQTGKENGSRPPIFEIWIL